VKSLRRRLVAWYVSVGAFIVLIIGLLAAITVIEAASFQGRQAMAAAARQMPQAVERYRATHTGMAQLDEYLFKHFATLGVIVHARPTFTRGAFLPGPPHMRHGPPRGRELRMGPNGTLFERLLAMQIKPITASFPGGEAFIFVDPHSLQGIFNRLGLFMLVLAVVVLTAAWRIAIAVSQNTLEPLLRTTEALDRFGSGTFTLVDVRPDDRSELGDLARAYNRAVGQITRALDERAKAEAEMRQFVADAGHQLRTPLTVIMGYVSSMAARATSPAESRRYEAMLAQSRRMKELIDRLITLARLEHTNPSNAQSVDLKELAQRVRATFSEAAQTRIAIHAPGEEAYASADESDVTEALCALVDNALKYAPHGDVEITIAREDEHWAMRVGDRGPGMTEDDLRSAFDRFYRGSASEDTIGTGLGLAIVRKSIERTGGTVQVRNRAGGGLEVEITLRSVPAARTTLSA
jgi:two-component system OmpR family sensor kinase